MYVRRAPRLLKWSTHQPAPTAWPCLAVITGESQGASPAPADTVPRYSHARHLANACRETRMQGRPHHQQAPTSNEPPACRRRSAHPSRCLLSRPPAQPQFPKGTSKYTYGQACTCIPPLGGITTDIHSYWVITYARARSSSHRPRTALAACFPLPTPNASSRSFTCLGPPHLQQQLHSAPFTHITSRSIVSDLLPLLYLGPVEAVGVVE